MASRIVMPKLSDTMEEGKILRWLKKEGETVEVGQPLAEVETDKATVEMEAYVNGVLRKLTAAEGETVAVGKVIGIIGGADEDISGLLTEAPATQDAPSTAAPASAPAPAPADAPPSRTPAEQRPAKPEQAPAERRPEAGPPAAERRGESRPDERGLKASPLALRMAAEAGVDLKRVQGSGPQGRIIKRDIEKAMTTPAPEGAAAPAARTPGGAEFEEVELSSIRRTIAKRLVQSKGPVPHFYLTTEVAMDRAWNAYRALREEKSPISINDIVIKATAAALRRHPELNASFAGDRLRLYNRIHIGMAVALDDGLITPIIRDADTKSLGEIAEEARRLADRARARKLQPQEFTGATFSISNLGMLGIDEFSAIINPPEAAILAVGAVRQAPVVVNGTLAVGYRMNMTLSVDHRVADGATAARFLQTLRRLLENPLLMA